jgi:penicillin-binding protein-related factor A (putative recombinase)
MWFCYCHVVSFSIQFYFTTDYTSIYTGMYLNFDLDSTNNKMMKYRNDLMLMSNK